MCLRSRWGAEALRSRGLSWPGLATARSRCRGRQWLSCIGRSCVPARNAPTHRLGPFAAPLSQGFLFGALGLYEEQHTKAEA